MPIAYAPQGLIGLLTPQANTTVEPEAWALLPSGISLINGRLVSAAPDLMQRLRDYFGDLAPTLTQFSNAPLSVLALACTGSSYVMGRPAEQAWVEAWSQRLGIPVQARLVDWAVVGVPAEIMGSGPVPAIQRLLAQRQLKVADIDYFEINEAFAVVNLHAERELGIPRERTNLYGGGISLGHPPGATGLRMTMTAMHHLADTGGRYAIISMCLGSGMGMATLIENALV